MTTSVVIERLTLNDSEKENDGGEGLGEEADRDGECGDDDSERDDGSDLEVVGKESCGKTGYGCHS